MSGRFIKLEKYRDCGDGLIEIKFKDFDYFLTFRDCPTVRETLEATLSDTAFDEGRKVL